MEVLPLDHVGPAWPGRGALLVAWLGGAQRGTIALDPDDPDGLPRVTFDALSPAAAAGLARAVALAEELLSSPPFASIVESWSAAPTRGGYFHASGSCGVGRVVDADGAVVGRRGLYVADASVLELPASGTMGPTALLADRLARGWLRTG
jgi:choline dehydrogenase-like flavoprotein